MLRSTVRKLSTSAKCYDKLYELRIYTIKPGNIKTAMEGSAAALPTRYKHSPGLGYFYSEIGGLGEAVHVWEYESYGQRAEIRKSLAGDPDWIAQATPMLSRFEKQDNLTMRLFPWSSIQKEVKAGGVFFMYSFTFLPSMSPETLSEQLQSFIKDAKLNALGVWREELGKNSLRNAYAIFHAEELDSDKNPALASPQAWAKLNQFTSDIHGRLLVAAPWSNPWK